MTRKSGEHATGHAERLLTGPMGRVSIVLSLGWLGLRLGREALPPLLPVLIETLAISPSQAGFCLTILWALYALVQYPGGRLSDQLSRITVLVPSLVILTGGFLALMTISTYTGLLSSVVLVGIGGGLYFTSSRTLISDMYVERRGLALGINDAAGTIGSAIAAGIVIVTLALGNWKLTFLPVVGVLAVTSVLLSRWRQESYVISQVDFNVQEVIHRVIAYREIRWLIVVYSLFNFATSGIVSFLPLFLQADKGFSPLLASASFSILFIVGMVASPIAGDLSDRLPRMNIATGGIALSILGLVGMLSMTSMPLIGASVLVYALGIRTCPPVMQAYLFDHLSKDTLGSDFGAIKTVYTGIGSLGPAFVGIIAERATYSAAFAQLIVCFVVSIALLWLLARRETRARP
ncbi:MFS transporter [Haladaptatus sp. DYSN1]|uniref:MFS transporter n=1 Tax=unclassified Haladaptatus TaxID=2622732 RepID=UPI0034E94A3B